MSKSPLLSLSARPLSLLSLSSSSHGFSLFALFSLLKFMFPCVYVFVSSCCFCLSPLSLSRPHVVLTLFLFSFMLWFWVHSICCCCSSTRPLLKHLIFPLFFTEAYSGLSVVSNLQHIPTQRKMCSNISTSWREVTLWLRENLCPLLKLRVREKARHLISHRDLCGCNQSIWAIHVALTWERRSV